MTSSVADAHMHLFERGFPGRYGRSPAGRGSEVDTYADLMDKHAISAALAIGYEDARFSPSNNDYLRRLATKRRWLSTVAFVPCSPPPRSNELSALMAAGHLGLALYVPDAQTAAAVRDWPATCWQLLNSKYAIISLNAPPEAIAGLDPIVRRNPACSFLFAHLGLPGRFVHPPSGSEVLQRIDPLLKLAAARNCYVKISGSYAVSEPPHAYPHLSAQGFAIALLDSFGPSRCLWGSDYSPSLDYVSFAQCLAMPALDRLSVAARAQVMGSNLISLLTIAGQQATACSFPV